MRIERKKNRYGDAFFILRMNTDERDSMIESLTKGIRISVKKEHQEEVIASMAFFERLSHTQYDEENEVSTIIHSSEIGGFLLDSLILSECVCSTLDDFNTLVEAMEKAESIIKKALRNQKETIQIQEETIQIQKETIQIQKETIERHTNLLRKPI